MRRTVEAADLDVPLSLLVVHEGPYALHEVGGVLVVVADDAHTARGVVRADIGAERVEVALDEVWGVSGFRTREGKGSRESR